MLTSVRLQWGVKIGLRDGTALNATVYFPRGECRPCPAVCTLTPYIADSCHERGMYFAARGIPFIVVDVRGRGNSEGEFRPRIQEASDGYDVVEWVARQPFCNGKVGMWGGSYAGYAQWATAKEFPPHLATIVPVASPFSGVDSPMRNNIFSPERVQWLMYTAGRTVQTQIFADSTFWSSSFRRWHESGRPFRELDEIVIERSPLFQEWISHPEPDAYWDAHNPTAEQYAALDIPILTITGAYDDDQPGALEHYKLHIRHGTAAARSRHYLIIGPWDHAGTRTPVLRFGGIEVGPESLLDLSQLHIEWYAWTMGTGGRPDFLKKMVAYYVAVADRWSYADSLEEIAVDYRELFLDSQGHANDAFRSGTMDLTPGSGGPDHYIYDPRDIEGPEVEAEAAADRRSLVDQSITLALAGKQLVYHTAPFETDLDICGFFKLEAWIAIDCPDTDLYTSILEVCSDGSVVRLSTDAMRARYREGLRSPKLIDTEAPLLYTFYRFTFIARRIRRGSRIRLVIAPMGRLLEGLFSQKNYNGGGVVSEESVSDARAVTVRLYHDAQHPSVLYVPVGQPQ